MCPEGVVGVSRGCSGSVQQIVVGVSRGCSGCVQRV